MILVRDAAGPLRVAAAAAGGAFVGSTLPGSRGHAMLAGAFVCGLLSLVSRRGIRTVLAVVAVTALAVGLAERARDGVTRTPLDGHIARTSAIVLEGALVSDPSPSTFSTRAIVRVSRFRGLHEEGWRSAGGRHLLVTAGRPSSSALAVLEAGERVVLTGILAPLEGFDAGRRDLHTVGRLRLRDVHSFRKAGSPLFAVANPVRGLVLQGSEHLAPRDRGLVAGFLVGDTRGVPDRMAAEFRDSGLSHLLAVSGANVAFVLALAGPVLRSLSMRGRFIGGVAVVAVFATMTRYEASVLRASAMAAIGLVAAVVGRPADGLRVLALAVTGLVLVDPFLVHSVAFQLSCGASLGILLWSRAIRDRLPGPRWFAETMATTLAAQLGVVPILIPIFGAMPLGTLPANALAVPIAGPLTVWGLVSGAVGGLVGSAVPEVTVMLQLPTVLMVRFVAAVAGVTARIPLAVNGRDAWGLAALVAFVAAFRRARRLGFGWHRRSDSAIASTTSRGEPS